MPSVSLITRLAQQLDTLETQILDFFDNSTIIKRRSRPHRDFDRHDSVDILRALTSTSNYWGDDDDKQRYAQIKLLKQYDSWFEHFRLLFNGSSEEVQNQIRATDILTRDWIEKKGMMNMPSTIEEAKDLFKNDFRVYHQLLQIFRVSEESKVIIVPDTNAIIQVPDVSRYREVAGQDEYTVVITPTVLLELDKLKQDHRNLDFKEKVKSVIRRLKGLRQQGSMIEGVTVHKTITVKMPANEPNFNRTLSWLDKSNNDDKLIASVLEIQCENPSSMVILVTSDINHQNKAEMANLPYAEPPGIAE